jgi:DNA-binding response OmpR family regulator
VDERPDDVDRDALLLVEDDEELRSMLAAALEERGFRVVTASDGAEALDALSWVPALPCLIVTDWRMPRIDGDALFQRLEALGISRRVPVLVITAAPNEAVPPELPVLRKPFELSTFVDAVELHAAD